MQSRDTTRIGKHFVVNECITSAKDSAQDLKEQKFEVLCQRFKTFGYLAFSSFFPESMSKELLAEITRVVGSERVASFEANLTTGFGDSERARAWKKVGSSVIVAKYYSNPLLQSTLKNILQHDKRLVVPPENLLFQLSWVRGKAPGDATSVHVDYYHVQQPEELGLPGLRTDDVLEEDDFKSFNVWTRLSEGPGNTSCLAVIPGSHLMEFDEAAKRAGKHFPDELEERMRTQRAQWHIFDGPLACPGVFVLMSLRLAHGSTVNTGKTATRFSFDARFRVPVHDERKIVYGLAPAPHWATCRKWTRKCNRDHEHLKDYVMIMLLVNSRLRRTGQPYLLKELLDMVFAELCHMVTPRFRLRRARFERTRTGTFNRFNRFATGDWGMHGRDLEDEGTGTDLEDEGTGTDD